MLESNSFILFFGDEANDYRVMLQDTCTRMYNIQNNFFQPGICHIKCRTCVTFDMQTSVPYFSREILEEWKIFNIVLSN